MAKAAVFAHRLDLFIDRTLSPEAQSRRLAEAARTAAGKLIADGRASSSYRRFVDGREGADEDSVAPAPVGKIVYRFNHMGAVATFALSFLKNRSPAASGLPARPKNGKHGAYRDSFWIGVNGRAMPAAAFDADLVPPGAELVVYNINAYSRKVDVQLVGGKSLSYSVPPGIFDDAVKAIRSRYGVLVDVQRVYSMRFSGQYILQQEQRHRTGRYAGRSRNRRGKPVESPALIIKPRQ
ncbi:hypothetical protein TSH100_04175 [Azospirillum sp. TSH100]|uniref:hypothetical protein n=1 Tax=Azospirillum sp. TSH100 TaxID=652764 RepID=UPI000D60F9B1|nr:hypothetical protein [Azospirillum sp. TSH100]PWC89841.1 hypothetical protein TSH100_04175 [Azospirillum sp. TSH100]QCG92319.1 hypothetical protein E6C72_31430 [Azospirillum sp. TSH100]